MRSLSLPVRCKQEYGLPSGGPIFLTNDLCISIPTEFKFNIITLTAAMTTLAFWCWNCGTTRSQICSASLTSVARYFESALNNVTRPHLRSTAISWDYTLCTHSTRRAICYVLGLECQRLLIQRQSRLFLPELGWHLQRPTKVNTLWIGQTIGLASLTISWSISKNPFSIHMVGFKSNNLATQITAVFRTYGDSS